MAKESSSSVWERCVTGTVLDSLVMPSFESKASSFGIWHLLDLKTSATQIHMCLCSTLTFKSALLKLMVVHTSVIPISDIGEFKNSDINISLRSGKILIYVSFVKQTGFLDSLLIRSRRWFLVLVS